MKQEILKAILENPLSLSSTTIISEDLAYVYGLFGVQSSYMSPITFVLFFTLGVLVGDLMLYFVGKYLKHFLGSSFGQKVERFIHKYAPKNLSSERFGRFEEFLVFTRFIPGTRLPTYLFCGYSGYPLFKFTLILTTTCLFYSLFGVALIYLTSYNATEEMNLLTRVLTSVFIAFTSIYSFKAFIFLRKLKLNYGEILTPLKIKILRLRHLEFWNPIFLYLPFVPRFLYIHFKYGGIKSLLSSNPSIKMSGLIGERKTDIDLLLKEYVPEHRLNSLHYNEESETENILNNLSFPMIVKPDSGMRGIDVEVVTDETSLRAVRDKSEKNLIAQELCTHQHEWGVFYIRDPKNSGGSVFSLTRKELPVILGDGVSSLYELIKKNKRLRLRFDWIFDNSKYSPREISKAGEVYTLTSKGSHSKGCLFLDESLERFPLCAKKIALILDQIPDFCVGRADIKFESHDLLAQGQFKIIEINGSGGESTNIYDAELSKREVYSILSKQWENIYKVGKNNRILGKETKLTLIDLFREILNYRKKGQ